MTAIEECVPFAVSETDAGLTVQVEFGGSAEQFNVSVPTDPVAGVICKA
jgi:hypothetical protein